MKRIIKTGLQFFFRLLGYEIIFHSKKDLFVVSETVRCRLSEITKSVKKIQYGSNNKFFNGWINTDWNLNTQLTNEPYILRIDLTKRHPFQDNVFEYAYSEDFIEHIGQDDQILFLSEVYRTLKPCGIFRMSYPGFEELLKNHFHTINYEFLESEIKNTYKCYGHKHHFTKEEITLLCKHIGFQHVKFLTYGHSECPVFMGIDTREEQANQNTFIELVK